MARLGGDMFNSPISPSSSYSGLAVQPNNDDGEAGDTGSGRDAIFGIAENATSEDNARVRRTITMVSTQQLASLARDS